MKQKDGCPCCPQTHLLLEEFSQRRHCLVSVGDLPSGPQLCVSAPLGR